MLWPKSLIFLSSEHYSHLRNTATGEYKIEPTEAAASLMITVNVSVCLMRRLHYFNVCRKYTFVVQILYIFPSLAIWVWVGFTTPSHVTITRYKYKNDKHAVSAAPMFVCRR